LVPRGFSGIGRGRNFPGYLDFSGSRLRNGGLGVTHMRRITITGCWDAGLRVEIIVICVHPLAVRPVAFVYDFFHRKWGIRFLW
jgi:hypothetical protein